MHGPVRGWSWCRWMQAILQIICKMVRTRIQLHVTLTNAEATASCDQGARMAPRPRRRRLLVLEFAVPQDVGGSWWAVVGPVLFDHGCGFWLPRRWTPKLMQCRRRHQLCCWHRFWHHGCWRQGPCWHHCPCRCGCQSWHQNAPMSTSLSIWALVFREKTGKLFGDTCIRSFVLSFVRSLVLIGAREGKKAGGLGEFDCSFGEKFWSKSKISDIGENFDFRWKFWFWTKICNFIDSFDFGR